MIRFELSKSTQKQLAEELAMALRLNNLRLFREVQALLWIGEGKSLEEIAELLGMSLRNLYNWVWAFMGQGMSWLRRQRYQGRGRKSKLSAGQKKKLSEMIEAGPEANGFESGCWNSAMIAHLTYLKFGVKYVPRYICILLKKLGFSYQKAHFVPASWDKEEVEKARELWVKETWPSILKKAKEMKAVILFGDEVSFAMWGSLGRTWARRGQQPEVKTKGIRKGLKMFGVIEFESGDFQYMESLNYSLSAQSFKMLKQETLSKEEMTLLKTLKNKNFQQLVSFIQAVTDLMGMAFIAAWKETLLRAAQVSGKFNGEKYVEFLKQLKQHFQAPIILIEDGAPYHTSRIVKDFVAQQGETFQVESLPTFSPDFNPIEKLWKNTKRDATHLKYFKTFEELRASVCNVFKKFLADATQVIRVMKKLRNEADVMALSL